MGSIAIVTASLGCAHARTAAPEATPATSVAATPASGAPAAVAARADSTARADTAAARAAAKPTPPATVTNPPDSAIVALLREGNRVLLFRHAATDWGQRDADVINYKDRASQRNLSPIGRAQADSIGKAVSALGLKIGRVLSSPMFRCRDTAEIAFGRADTTSDLLVKSRTSRDARIAMLSTILKDGKLFVQVTHQDPYIPLFHFQRDQLREGDGLIVQPEGDGHWRLLAQLSPADWTRLAARFGAK